MPPKKLKDLAEAPVYKMSHEEQVQLLSDALLREYMHRRGFRATLKAFDEEHPRDDNTISSRAVMSDLMALQPEDQQRLKGDGIETIMEMLCKLRVERRMEVEKLTAEAEAPLPKVPAKYDALEEKLAERAARAEKKQKRKKSRKSSGTGEEVGGHHRKAKAKTRAEQGGAAQAAGMTIDDLLASSHSSSNNSSGGAGSSGSSNASARSDNDESDDEGRQHRPKSDRRRGSAKQATLRKAARKGSGASGGEGASSAAAARSTNAPVQPAWMEIQQKSKKSAAAKDGGSDDDDAESSNDGADEHDDGAGSVASEDLGGTTPSAELRDELSAAFQLLCGFEGSLTRAFLEQGFTFDEELECALIQWRPGGCDAVLAPTQAFVAAYFYEREVYVKRQQRQRECLLRALCTMLEQAQPNPSRVVLIDGAWRPKGSATRFTRAHLRQQAEAARTRCWTHFSSADDVKEVLRSTLLDEDRWMKPRGCGLLNFVFSLLLSRGVDVVQRELTAAAAASSSTSASDDRPSLLSTSGDGRATMALANLALTGKATSYCHNGVQNGSQIGYATRLKCGMLNGDAAASDLDAHVASSALAPPSAYTNATDPVLPSWVLYHKGHFANLYMTKDTRPVFQQKLNLGGSASEDVVYWDAATEDDLYTLTVTVRSITFGGGGGARNAKSFVNAAIMSVPVWASAEVNWNGEAPLRD